MQRARGVVTDRGAKAGDCRGARAASEASHLCNRPSQLQA